MKSYCLLVVFLLYAFNPPSVDCSVQSFDTEAAALKNALNFALGGADKYLSQHLRAKRATVGGSIGSGFVKSILDKISEKQVRPFIPTRFCVPGCLFKTTFESLRSSVLSLLQSQTTDKLFNPEGIKSNSAHEGIFGLRRLCPSYKKVFGDCFKTCGQSVMKKMTGFVLKPALDYVCVEQFDAFTKLNQTCLDELHDHVANETAHGAAEFVRIATAALRSNKTFGDVCEAHSNLMDTDTWVGLSFENIECAQATELKQFGRGMLNHLLPKLTEMFAYLGAAVPEQCQGLLMGDFGVNATNVTSSVESSGDYNFTADRNLIDAVMAENGLPQLPINLTLGIGGGVPTTRLLNAASDALFGANPRIACLASALREMQAADISFRDITIPGFLSFDHKEQRSQNQTARPISIEATEKFCRFYKSKLAPKLAGCGETIFKVNVADRFASVADKLCNNYLMENLTQHTCLIKSTINGFEQCSDCEPFSQKPLNSYCEYTSCMLDCLSPSVRRECGNATLAYAGGVARQTVGAVDRLAAFMSRSLPDDCAQILQHNFLEGPIFGEDDEV